MTPDTLDAASELTQLVSATHCEECGDKLLDARRKAYPGCTMCVSCQGEQELRNKQRGG